MRRRIVSQETHNKMSRWQKGQSKSLKRKQSMSVSARNRPEEHNKRIANAHAKVYFFLSPLGEVIKIKNIREFCRNNIHLDRRSMLRLISEEYKQYKWWRKINV